MTLVKRATKTSRVIFGAGAAALALLVLSLPPSAAPHGAALSLKVVARGLAEPVSLAFAPGSDGQLYVGERRGTVRVVSAGRALRTYLLDIRSRIKGIRSNNERGFLALAFAPSFESGGRFYVSYTTAVGDMHVSEMVVRHGSVDAAKERPLLTVSQRPFHMWHFAGELQFDASGRLLVSTGDGGYWRQPLPNAKKARPLEGDPYGNSQNPEVPNAKLLAIDINAASPSWNTLAMGLRNPWRFSVDRANGDIWIGDVGFSRFEEVDVIRAGDPLLNFGWSVYEARTARHYRGIPPKLSPAGQLTWPWVNYAHGRGDCAIIGGYVYRGAAVPSLRGRYVFGDYCSGRIWSVAAANAAGPITVEPIRVPHLTAFAEDSKGELYAASGDGTIFQLVGGS